MNYMDRIKSEREDHDESQRDLAKILDTSQVMIWKYETERSELPVRLLIEICHHYQISAEYLLGIPYNYRRPRPRTKID